PINWAIINGEKETGVTTFFIQHEIDTGNILFAEKVAIGDDETAGDVHEKLMRTGADLVVKKVTAIENNSYQEKPQDEILDEEGKALDTKHAPKIFKETCLIDWSKPVNDVYNHIRGLSPYPAAYTHLDGKTLKVYSATR